MLYADDSGKTYGKSNDNIEANVLQQNLSNLAEWCEDWQLSINSEKCEVLHIGKKIAQFRYQMNGTEFKPKTKCRYLGVIVGNDLYYRNHYEEIVKNAHFLCKQLKMAFSSRNIDFLMLLFSTYVLPKMEYYISTVYQRCRFDREGPAQVH